MRTEAHQRSFRAGGVVAALGGLLAAALLLTACTNGQPAPESTAAPTAAPTETPAPESAEAEAIRDVVQQQIDETGARATIVRVTRGDDLVLMQAWGESVTGVPATTDMHFRNGAIAIPQVASVLLQLVDEDVVSLEDALAEWLPDVENSERVTLGQLAQMTSGYADYLWSDEFVDALLLDPFRQWQPEELYPFGTDEPLVYEPGTNWNYSHTDYVLLGLALEEITDQPLEELIAQRILDPLELTQTAAPDTPEMLDPVLHAFDSERREVLGIADDLPFMEDSTYWNPSWTLPRGAVQNSDVTDTATLIRAIGRGELVSPESHVIQTAPTLRGETSAVEGCPSCFEQNEHYTFGYGIVLSGDWMLQSPLFYGYHGVGAYLPGEDLAIAVVATFGDNGTAADDTPEGNLASAIFTAIADEIAPGTTPGS